MRKDYQFSLISRRAHLVMAIIKLRQFQRLIKVVGDGGLGFEEGGNLGRW